MAVEINIINLNENSFTDGSFVHFEENILEYRIIVHKGAVTFDGVYVDDKIKYFSQDIIKGGFTANPYITIKLVSKELFAQLLIVKNNTQFVPPNQDNNNNNKI